MQHRARFEVSRRRPYGPPLQTARLYIWFAFCARVSVQEKGISLSEF